MQYIYWFITLLVLVIFVTFTVANMGLVAIDFWPFEFQFSMPIAPLLLGCLLAGFVTGAFLMWLRFGAARARARRAEQRAKLLEHELVELKRTSGGGGGRSGGAPQLSAPRPIVGASGYKAVSGGN